MSRLKFSRSVVAGCCLIAGFAVTSGGQPVAPVPSRQLLFRDLSDTFMVDQTLVPTTEPSVRSADEIKLENDPDALVARIARAKIREDALQVKVRKMIDRLSDDLPIDAAADVVDLLQGLHDDNAAKADDNHGSKALAALLNSRAVQKSMVSTVLRQECDCAIVDEEAQIRRWMVDDMKAAPRGGTADPEKFHVRYALKDNLSVTAEMSNRTGQTLHHCLLVATVPHDEKKVADYAQGQLFGQVITDLILVAGGGGPELEEVLQASRESLLHCYRCPRGFVVYVPEWGPDQKLETALLNAMWLQFAGDGELSISCDEATAVGIPLRLREMAGARRPGYHPGDEYLPLTDPDDLANKRLQHQSMHVHVDDAGMTTYTFLAYPGVWSETIVVPLNRKHHSVAWQTGADVEMLSDGIYTNPKAPGMTAGSRLQFRAKGDRPVPMVIRITPNEVAPQDKEAFFKMADYPPKVDDPVAPDRKAKADAIISLIKRNGNFDGKWNGSDPYQLHLEWDEQLSMATGWVLNCSSGNRKLIEGRVVDNHVDAPTLQLVETGALFNRGDIFIGTVYRVQLSDDSESFTGQWSRISISPNNVNQRRLDKGQFDMTPGLPAHP